MSINTTPDQGSRHGSPKRKRSESLPSEHPQQHRIPERPGARRVVDSEEPSDEPNAKLQYAYDDDDASDAAAEDAAERVSEPARVTRPRRLNYAPHLTLRGHKRGVAAVKFSPDGKLIASCSADGTIKIWDAQNGTLIHTLEGHLAGISTIAWSPDSKILASGSDDKSIRLWDVQAGKCLETSLIGHHNYVYSIAFSPKGNMLASGSYDEAVFLWDLRTARVMRSLPSHSDPVSGVDFVRDGTLVGSCSSDGLTRIWDTGTGQCLKTLVHEDNAAVTSVKFSPNGKYLLASTLDSCLRLWNYVEGRCLKTYQGHKNVQYSINTCFGIYASARPARPAQQEEDGDAEQPLEPQRWAFVACGSEDGKAVIWDVSSKEVLQVLTGHEGTVLGVDASTTEDAIVTGGSDKTVRVWRRTGSSTDETVPMADTAPAVLQPLQPVYAHSPAATNGHNEAMDES